MSGIHRKLTFNYEFIKQGSMVSIDAAKGERCFTVKSEDGSHIKNYPIKNTVILDVGNLLTEGVIDHHHLKNGIEVDNTIYKSTTGILSVYPSLVKNICEHCSEVTIVLHQQPDFDCFASAYLVQEILLTGTLPDNSKEIVEYSELIDSGKLKISPANIVTPYTISLVIGDTAEAKLANNFEYQQYHKNEQWFNMYRMKDTAVMKRGLELIDYLFERLKLLSDTEKSVSSFVILGGDHPFSEEEEIIKADFQKYEADLANGICEKHKIRLPQIDDHTTLIEVDGLVWNSVPSCSLHKLWARSDQNSPSGTGYIFTFIPAENKKTIPKTLELFNEDTQDKIKETRRVIISVDPYSKVTLKNLGKSLELEELEAEEKIFGDEKGKWRSRSKKRYKHEEWCNNMDPWYDGSSHDYTIVDAPGVGSLLTRKQIKKVTLNYTEPKLIKNFSRVVHPFTFDYSKFKTICKKTAGLENTECIHESNQSSRRNEYFRPYIKKYLFGIDEDKSYSELSDYCREFRLNLNIDVHNLCIPADQQHIFTNARYSVNVKEVKLVIFKYGVGFLILDNELQRNKNNSEIFLEEFIEMNKLVCEKKYIKHALQLEYAEVFKNSGLDLNTCEKGIIFTNVLLDPATYYESAKEEIIYKLSSNTLWKEPFDLKNSNMINSANMFYYLNEYIGYGFTKNGSSQLIINQDTEKMTENEKEAYVSQLKTLEDINKTVDFDSFLLVLHQRYCLMDFSKKLSKFGSNGDFKSISKLRTIILEFIIQGWYSQITNDEIGMDKYKRWLHIFETEKLHDEVLDQVSMIDDHNKAKNSSSLEKVSYFFFPLIMLNAFIGIGFITFEEVKDFEGYLPWIYLASPILVIIISWLTVVSFRKIWPFFKTKKGYVTKVKQWKRNKEQQNSM